MSNEHSEDKYNVHAHISSTGFNVAILLALLALTGLTVAAYNVRLGEWNLLVAVVIASVKVALVATYYMHLRHDRAFNVLFFSGSLLFVMTFIILTENDTKHRGELDPNWGSRRDPRTGQFAAGTALEIVAAGAEEQPLPEAAEAAHGE